MEIGPSFVADRQSAKAIEPGVCPLNDPPMPAQPLARLDPPPGDAWRDPPLAARGATACVVVALVGVQLDGAAARSTASPTGLADWRDGIERRLEHARIMDIGGREPYREGDAASVDHQMALRARFATVRWIRPGRFAPLLAATLAESSDARDQSNWSASARRCSSSRCKRSQTPARCQSRSRRQHVIPLPQPSSCGSSSQPMPLLSTNRMPVNAARSLMRGRPPLGLSGSCGSNGATAAHSSSLTSGLVMPPV